LEGPASPSAGHSQQASPARRLLFIAGDRDPGSKGGHAAQPFGLCDTGHRAKGKPGLAGDLPDRLTGPARGIDAI